MCPPPTAKAPQKTHKKWWQRAYAYMQTQGVFDYWQFPNAEDEAAGLYRIVETGSMTVEDVLHDLIEVCSVDEEGLDEMAAEFPNVSGKIAEMIEYRKQVGAHFEKIIAAKQAIGEGNGQLLRAEVHSLL